MPTFLTLFLEETPLYACYWFCYFLGYVLENSAVGTVLKDVNDDPVVFTVIDQDLVIIYFTIYNIHNLLQNLVLI